MTINLSIRNYEVWINGIDCSRGITSLQGSDSKAEETTGLILFTGSLTLGCADEDLGLEIDLDDRDNRQWSKGNLIIIKIADSGYTPILPPRGGTVWILESSFNPNDNKLTIQFGDILSLLKYKEPSGDRSKICTGTAKSKTAIINELLTAAGAPILKVGDSIPGALDSPISKGIEGSYIDQAGKIAASSGCVIYVDSNGDVRAKEVPINAISTTEILVTNYASSERLPGELPPDKVVVTGNATTARKNPDGSGDVKVTIEYGSAASAGVSSSALTVPTNTIIVKKTEFSDRFDRNTKTRTVITHVLQPAGVIFPELSQFQGDTTPTTSEHRTITYYYETNKPIAGFETDDHCQQGNQGRLYQIVELAYQPFALILKEVYASYKIRIVSPTKPVIAEYKITEFNYDLGLSAQAVFGNDSGSDWIPEQPLSGIQYSELTYKPIGAIAPVYSGEDPPIYSTGTNEGGVTALENPEALKPAYRKIQTWTEPSLGEYQYQVSDYVPLIEKYPEIASKLADKIPDLDDLLSNLVVLVPNSDELDISNSGGAQPPAPDTYQPEYNESTSTVRGEYKTPADSTVAHREREKNLSFDYISATGINMAAARAQAKVACDRLAELWAKIIWGRFKASSYITDLDDVWWDYSPLSRVDVLEPRNKTYSYLGDGWSIAMAGKRTAVGFDGILLGKKVTLSVPNLDGETVIDPETGDPITPETLEIVSVIPPYQQVGIHNAALGMGVEFKATLYYVPLLQTMDLNSALGMSGSFSTLKSTVAGFNATLGMAGSFATYDIGLATLNAALGLSGEFTSQFVVIPPVDVTGEGGVIYGGDGTVSVTLFPFAYWNLTANALDTAGSRNLTNNGSVSFASGYADFNGSSNYLSVANDASIQRGGTKSFTLFFSFRLTATSGTQFIVSKYDSGANAAEYELSCEDGTLYFYSGGIISVATADTNWHTICLLHNGTTGAIEAYYDNVLVNNGSGSYTGNTSAINFGRRSDGTFHSNVDMKYFGLWTRILDSTERTYWHNSGAGRAFP